MPSSQSSPFLSSNGSPDPNNSPSALDWGTLDTPMPHTVHRAPYPDLLSSADPLAQSWDAPEHQANVYPNNPSANSLEQPQPYHRHGLWFSANNLPPHIETRDMASPNSTTPTFNIFPPTMQQDWTSTTHGIHPANIKPDYYQPPHLAPMPYRDEHHAPHHPYHTHASLQSLSLSPYSSPDSDASSLMFSRRESGASTLSSSSSYLLSPYSPLDNGHNAGSNAISRMSRSRGSIPSLDYNSKSRRASTTHLRSAPATIAAASIGRRASTASVLTHSSSLTIGGEMPTRAIRSSQACNACRRRKVRCVCNDPGEGQTCARCSKMGLSCVWDDIDRSAGVGAKRGSVSGASSGVKKADKAMKRLKIDTVNANSPLGTLPTFEESPPESVITPGSAAVSGPSSNGELWYPQQHQQQQQAPFTRSPASSSSPSMAGTPHLTYSPSPSSSTHSQLLSVPSHQPAISMPQLFPQAQHHHNPGQGEAVNGHGDGAQGFLDWLNSGSQPNQSDVKGPYPHPSQPSRESHGHGYGEHSYPFSYGGEVNGSTGTATTVSMV